MPFYVNCLYGKCETNVVFAIVVVAIAASESKEGSKKEKKKNRSSLIVGGKRKGGKREIILSLLFLLLFFFPAKFPLLPSLPSFSVLPLPFNYRRRPPRSSKLPKSLRNSGTSQAALPCCRSQKYLVACHASEMSKKALAF